MGIENVLALRGDIPKGWESARGDFAHADGLMSYLREICPDLCIGVAGYPEKHIEAASFEEDICHLKTKQDNGAQFITTQICHSIDSFSRYIEMIRAADINMPVIAGLMPVLFREGTLRMTLSNGCSIPAELAQIIGKYEGDPVSFKAAGKEYTVRQIERFMRADISGLHIYTMNKHEDLAEILAQAGIAESV
jgi:methylenetetrahydrofolate reductase (NADPH)